MYVWCQASMAIVIAYQQKNLYFQGYTPNGLGSRSIPVDKVAG